MSSETDDRQIGTLRRREALIAAGSAGAGLAWVLSRVPSALADAVARPAAACVLTREVMEGPYWIANRLKRRDVRDGRPGLPLLLTLTIQDAATCRAIRGADVEIWHADAGGVYSGYTGAPPPGPTGHATPNNRKRFLRGHQRSDARGRATFVTIYPGWYRGRTPHIHVKVHVGGNVVHTGQVFFPDATSQAVYRTGAYRSRGAQDTSNARDGIYQAAGGRVAIARLARRRRRSGYTGAITLAVDRG